MNQWITNRKHLRSSTERLITSGRGPCLRCAQSHYWSLLHAEFTIT